MKENQGASDQDDGGAVKVLVLPPPERVPDGLTMQIRATLSSRGLETWTSARRLGAESSSEADRVIVDLGAAFALFGLVIARLCDGDPAISKVSAALLELMGGHTEDAES